MIHQVPFCRQQSSGRVAPIGECLPPTCDDAAVVRPNPDPFSPSHAFKLSGPDELDDTPIEYPTTRCHCGARMRAVKNTNRWAVSKASASVQVRMTLKNIIRWVIFEGISEGVRVNAVEDYHHLGDFEGIGERVSVNVIEE
jgi:hypothetical protein